MVVAVVGEGGVWVMSFWKKMFCCHEWEEIERGAVTREYSFMGGVSNSWLILYICKKCGKMKKVNFP